MSKRILLLGGGGHCKSVLDVLLNDSSYIEIKIIDKSENIGKKVMGIPIIGTDEDLQHFFDIGFHYAFISLGSIGDYSRRRELYKAALSIGFEFPNIIDNSANYSQHITLGNGVFIARNSTINSGAIIGDFSIINSAAIIEHDCIIGKYVHISSGAVLCGNVRVEDGAHIGAGSVVKQDILIGNNTLIGLGSVVTKNIGTNIVAFGNPCKFIKFKREPF